MSCIVLDISPPYLNVVMQNCCIRKSKVLSLMYSTRLMGDVCFNNTVEQKHFTIFVFFYAIWASIETL